MAQGVGLKNFLIFQAYCYLIKKCKIFFDLIVHEYFLTSIKAFCDKRTPFIGFFMSSIIPKAKLSGLSGSKNKQFFSFKISLKDGRLDAIIGFRAAIYSNIFMGEVYISDIFCF